MIGSYQAEVICKRFRLPSARTLIAGKHLRVPMAFTHLKSVAPEHGLSLPVPPEDAYAIQVVLGHIRSEFWTDGRSLGLFQTAPADMILMDLRRNPVVSLQSPFETMRFYISRSSLADLNPDNNRASVHDLRSQDFVRRDRTMYGLALAIMQELDEHKAPSALFLDYIALAFHAHIVRACGKYSEHDGGVRQGLTARQLARAQDFMTSRLDCDLSVEMVATECGLSTGHFARAFRVTAGVPPHRWLVRQRLEHSKVLLTEVDLDLAEIAVACGFADQSHFTKSFLRQEGQTPRKWRRAIAHA